MNDASHTRSSSGPRALPAAATSIKRKRNGLQRGPSQLKRLRRDSGDADDVQEYGPSMSV